jgi:hypothetical protein
MVKFIVLLAALLTGCESPVVGTWMLTTDAGVPVTLDLKADRTFVRTIGGNRVEGTWYEYKGDMVVSTALALSGQPATLREEFHAYANGESLVWNALRRDDGTSGVDPKGVWSGEKLESANQESKGIYSEIDLRSDGTAAYRVKLTYGSEAARLYEAFYTYAHSSGDKYELRLASSAKVGSITFHDRIEVEIIDGRVLSLANNVYSRTR